MGVGGDARGAGEGISRGERDAAPSGWLQITNRCDPADKRSNLDKSQALELVACVPSPPLCLFSILSLSQGRGRRGQGAQRGEAAGGEEGREGASFIFWGGPRLFFLMCFSQKVGKCQHTPGELEGGLCFLKSGGQKNQNI